MIDISSLSYKEIIELQSDIERRIRDIKQERINTFKENAQKNIGRCFIVREGKSVKYAKVLYVPQEDYSMSGRVNFNEYQYPALWIDEQEHIPFVYDTIFSGAWGEGHLVATSESYQEISQEEFNEKLKQVTDKFLHYMLI